MSRSWFRVSIRIFSVFLLIAGLVAGVYIGVTRHTSDAAATKAAREASHERALDALDRVSRDASRAARDYKLRGDAASRAKRKADAAGKDAADRAAAADKSLVDKPKPSPSSAPIGPIPASCRAYSGNKAIGCKLMLDWGFGLDQMPCLEKIWDHESGWNEHAQNPSSGAYGIPQALPGDKMAQYGDDWRDNPATQIKWGLDYVKGRYDSPCGAWSSWQANGWY